MITGIDEKSVPFFFAEKSVSIMKGVDIYGFDHFCAVGDDSLERHQVAQGYDR